MAKVKNAPDQGGEIEVKVSKEKSKIELAMAELNKRYGSGTVIGSHDINSDLDVFDTGSLSLNVALGIGGWPTGKLIEIQGPFSSGKSTLTLHAIAENQKKYPEKKALLIDFEHSFDKYYAINLGVDPDRLLIAQPANAEEGYNIAEKLIRTGDISICVVDSHTAGIPKAIVDEEVGKATIALQARVNSQAVGKLKPLLSVYGCTIIAVSQLRTALGGYVAVDTSTGGNAFKFYCDIRLKVSRVIDKEKGLDKVTVVVHKNKCAPPFSKAEFSVGWGKGIDRKGEVIDAAVILGLIEKGGSWFTIGETKLQGIPAVAAFFDDNEDFYKDIEAKVLESMKVEKVDPGTIEED